MVLKHYYSSGVQVAMHNRRDKTRDGVMGIGAESYAIRTMIPGKLEFTTEPLGPQTPPSTHEEDDSGPEVVVVSTSLARKRKPSIASTPGPSNKRARTARALSDEPKLSDSESDEDSGEDSGECDDDEAEDAVDPQHNQKAAQASKYFDLACKRCKTDANKALKAKYDLQISKLKSEHKQELREIKADRAQILTDTKNKANKEKAKMKAKYEGYIKDLKSHRDEKIAGLVDKHKETTEEWQDKADEYRKKIKKLTAQRDEAETKRKEIEKSAADEVKAAENDLKAGERKLREERKQMLRDMQQEIDILKPQHSTIVKEKEKVIKDFTQNILKLEKDVQSRDHTLQRVQTSHQTLQQQHQQLKTEHSDAQRHIKQLEKDLHDSKKYAEGVNGRADVSLVRAQEKLELQEKNTKEHANRVINLQRENYQLKDNLATTALLAREKRDEVNRLKAELQSTKAELGVVKDMEEMSGGFE